MSKKRLTALLCSLALLLLLLLLLCCCCCSAAVALLLLLRCCSCSLALLLLLLLCYCSCSAAALSLLLLSVAHPPAIGAQGPGCAAGGRAPLKPQPQPRAQRAARRRRLHAHRLALNCHLARRRPWLALISSRVAAGAGKHLFLDSPGSHAHSPIAYITILSY